MAHVTESIKCLQFAQGVVILAKPVAFSLVCSVTRFGEILPLWLIVKSI